MPGKERGILLFSEFCKYTIHRLIKRLHMDCVGKGKDIYAVYVCGLIQVILKSIKNGIMFVYHVLFVSIKCILQFWDGCF